MTIFLFLILTPQTSWCASHARSRTFTNSFLESIYAYKFLGIPEICSADFINSLETEMKRSFPNDPHVLSILTSWNMLENTPQTSLPLFESYTTCPTSLHSHSSCVELYNKIVLLTLQNSYQEAFLKSQELDTLLNSSCKYPLLKISNELSMLFLAVKSGHKEFVTQHRSKIKEANYEERFKPFLYIGFCSLDSYLDHLISLHP
ncbi:hypothetical protein [Candidatus Clavichlamydia salmonicola]|uniref:hypothetical protein n=1 Tax=Candidatus Clavichlamydia salmonicola TaxID=469812 RepID=UPI001891E3A3|nr:hypothetical protein [Candidatus Clavichlamydia salmonicola]